jgi:phosphate transport system permease protein
LRSIDRTGNRVLYGLCAVACVLLVLTMAEIGYQVISGSSQALSKFGPGFLFDTVWQPNFGRLGAGTVLFGTLMSSLIALVLASGLGISIGIYLSMLAPRRLAAVVGPMVELLAAIPSVIVGFWGLLVLAPFLQKHVEPWLHDSLGFIPLFGTPQPTGISIFTAGLVLTLMVLPIIASLSRDLFLTVPPELKDGAEALGATRWEVIRGVVLPTTVSGVSAAAVLGLGRALGEAVAVAAVIGDGNGIHASLFQPGATLASRIALQFSGSVGPLHTSALFYLAMILFAIGMITNLAAQRIAGGFGVRSAGL